MNAPSPGSGGGGCLLALIPAPLTRLLLGDRPRDASHSVFGCLIPTILLTLTAAIAVVWKATR